MKWIRKILQCSFNKEEIQYRDQMSPKVYVGTCGWGILRDFDHKGAGYIQFDSGGGQIIRNWDHFFDIVESIETRDK